MKKLLSGMAVLLGAALLFADPAASTAGNEFESAFGTGVTIVVDKDMSVKGTPELSGATIEEVEYEGQKCLKVTKNSKGEIRCSFVFDTPISCANLNKIKFSVSGFDGWDGYYNFGVFYTSDGKKDPVGSFYIGTVSEKKWSTFEKSLVGAEQWGNNFSKKKEVAFVQFWSNNSDVVYIKDLSFIKK